jgi:hypothetical protein
MHGMQGGLIGEMQLTCAAVSLLHCIADGQETQQARLPPTALLLNKIRCMILVLSMERECVNVSMEVDGYMA